jgi:beta-phosphoglucomutase-like phosphatase (HAD superfamily)
MLQAFFWDDDAVLVDTEGLFFAASRRILVAQGSAFDRQDFAEISLRSERSIFDLLPQLEDSERGLRSAVSAGMRCIMVPNPLAGDTDRTCSHALVASVSEVPEIIAGLL